MSLGGSGSGRLAPLKSLAVWWARASGRWKDRYGGRSQRAAASLAAQGKKKQYQWKGMVAQLWGLSTPPTVGGRAGQEGGWGEGERQPVVA